MAEILIHENETYRDRMPDLCMAYGEPATTEIRTTFSWFPPWLGVTAMIPLLYIILVSSMTKRMVVEVPTCHKHRNYFLMRQLWIWLSFLVVGLLFGGMFAVFAAAELKDAMALPCVGGAFAFVIWLIAVIIIQSMMIKPTEITDRSITLKGVHAGFSQAFFDYQDNREQRRRRRLDEEDFDDRPRRRATRDDEDYEPRPRRDSRTNIRRRDDDEE
jgi:hypothetical protein